MTKVPFSRVLLLLCLLLATAGALHAAEEKDPRLEEAFDLAARGEKAAAAQILSSYLRQHPGDQQTRAWYGEIQLDLLHLEAAIDALRQGAEGRSDPRALRELAESYVLAGRPERAERVYRTLLKEAPADPAVRNARERLEERVRARSIVSRYDRGLGIAIILICLVWLTLGILLNLYLEHRFPTVRP